MSRKRMTIHTPDSLRATRRRLAKRVGRIEQAERVLAERRAGAALHLQYTKQGPCWMLTTGRQVSDVVAKLVIASSSVVGVGDALFAGVACQSYRWWQET
jgi:hypothetical protein